MKRAIVAVAALGCLASACGGSTSSVGPPTKAASCAAPRLSVAPSVARAGDRVRVTGIYFAADCYDMGQPGLPPPLRNLTLQLLQRGKAWTVASGIDAAGRRFVFHEQIRLPTAANPGAAKLAVKGHGLPTTVQVEPRRQ